MVSKDSMLAAGGVLAALPVFADTWLIQIEALPAEAAPRIDEARPI